MSNDPNIGALFGLRWRIERPLGAGGMGSVYVARHENTGRRVALKVIKGEGTASAELAARFVRETQALAALSHPNVVTFLDSGCEGATCFLVMELLQGRSLRTLMGRPVEWRRAFRIGADVCRALAAVHKQGIVHRDLKPDNIFLQEAEGHDEIAKLIDFGIVRLQEGWSSSTAATSTGAVIGTPGYISPEQLQGQAASPASDVYAVGVILYELVTGRFPFQAPTPHAMLVKQLIEALPPPHVAGVPLPAHVEAVILHCMERDPAQRAATAHAALAELNDALARGGSLPPDAATETGTGRIEAAREALAAPLAQASSVAAPPAVRPTEPTGTVAPLAQLAQLAPLAVPAPARRATTSRAGLVLALALMAGVSTCAVCAVVASQISAREAALDIEAPNVELHLGAPPPPPFSQPPPPPPAAPTWKGKRRPSDAEARALVFQQLFSSSCDGEPPPKIERLEFSVESGHIRLVTPTRDNALLQCVAQELASFDAPTFPGKPQKVVIRRHDLDELDEAP
ncbi:MAG: serine/threonine protein kinase [Deltaproteobacteria bacterium]|nr:serine/threonine protein kinase [Deltaproteobacteria bacterium]